MNIRQTQSAYLCPRCHGEDQNFIGGFGDTTATMNCNNCGHSIPNIIPGGTPYGPMNPRVQIVNGRNIKMAGAPPKLRTREEIEEEDRKKEEARVEAIKQKKIASYRAMGNILEHIELPDVDRWDVID